MPQELTGFPLVCQALLRRMYHTTVRSVAKINDVIDADLTTIRRKNDSKQGGRVLVKQHLAHSYVYI